MQKQNRLGSNSQFQYVYRRGKRFASKKFVLLYVKSQRKKVGFSVSKKIGNAVIRNRMKRRLRECVRPMLPSLQNGLYVFVVRPGAEALSYQEICNDVMYLVRKSGTLLL